MNQYQNGVPWSAQVIQIITREWQLNPTLLERDVPPWISFDLYQRRHVRITSKQLFYFTCNDFWWAVSRLMKHELICKAYGIHVTREPDKTRIYFTGVEPYAQRLSQELVNDLEFLIPDLRQIIASYIFFI